MNIKRLAWILSIAICIVLATSMITYAQGKGKGNGNGGGGGGDSFNEVVYFTYSSQNMQMNPDGSGKQPLNIGWMGSLLEPSHAAHDGQRLFAVPTPGLNGSTGIRILRDDGSVAAGLTGADDPGWLVDIDGDVRWVSDGIHPDGMLSWVSTRIVNDVEELAVVRASTVFDPAGDLIGINANSIEHFVGLSLRYDWSPDGTMIAFVSNQSQLWTYDTLTDSFDVLVSDWVWSSPVWSPDGTMIAYTINDPQSNNSAQEFRVEVIDVLSDAITVVDVGRMSSPLDGTNVYRPNWSPDGSQLTYLKGSYNGFNGSISILLKSASGKGKSRDLTKDLPDAQYGVSVLGWRMK